MTIWAWIRKTLGFDRFDRLAILEERAAHNNRSTEGAIEAFKQFAKDAER